MTPAAAARRNARTGQPGREGPPARDRRPFLVGYRWKVAEAQQWMAGFSPRPVTAAESRALHDAILDPE